jgi:eukaryotic-like serine/threonine-protein kinase
MPKFSTSSSKDILVHIGIILAGFFILFFAFFFLYLPWTTNHGESITVPDLKGMTVSEMEDVLDDKNLEYEISDSSFVLNAKPLTVYSQYPKSNSTVKEGRKIYITIVSDQAPMVSIPDVVGRSFESGKNQLLSVGLVPDKPEYIPAIEENTILKIKVNGAEVALGQKIPKGSKVVLVVGDGYGNQNVDVPNVTGMMLDEAEILIVGQGLNIGSIIYQDAVDIVPGTIMQQRPAVGNKMKVGDVVDVWVAGSAESNPPAPVETEQ